uniref:Uncharacterized protein n=1 Tax=Muribaculaceae bacterium Z82 TaxID=2304548 RepID=A0A7C9JDR3_9BACT
MADSKSAYSEAADYYVKTTAAQDEAMARAYAKARARKDRHGHRWETTNVNLNEICDRFAPGDRGEVKGTKYIFAGERYSVVADMAAGYARIYDRVARKYTLLDGSPCDNDDLTHFRILKRDEM